MTTPDTATDTGGSVGAPVAEISARLHDEIGSLVYVTWQQEQAGEAWVEYSVGDDLWRTSPVQVVGVGAQESLLLGVPFATTVTFQVVTDTGAGTLSSESASITTDALPDRPVSTRAELLNSTTPTRVSVGESANCDTSSDANALT